MKYNPVYRFVLLAAVLCSAACTTEDLGAGAQPEKAPVINTPEGAAEGEILVKFRPEVSQQLDQAHQTRSLGNGQLTRSGIATVDHTLDAIGAYRIERIFPVDPDAEERTRHSGLHLWYLVHFDPASDLSRVAADLSQLGELSKVEFSHQIKRNAGAKAVPASAVPAARTADASQLRFNDPDLFKQWHYVNAGDGSLMPNTVVGADVNCKAAWEKCTGDPSIIVAVMDEGVDWTHPDLQANMWINEDEVYKSFKDNDGNGYDGDYFGYNFSRSTGVITWDAVTDTGHGTHVAGTIAAVNNNNEGVCGIAGGDGTTDSGVKIMTLQTFSGNYGTTNSNQAKAIKYAADNGAVILQCSWGYVSPGANPLYYPQLGPGTDEEYTDTAPLMKEAFDYFIYNAGSTDGPIEGGIVVFASGNENAPAAGYPGAFSDYICVSAMTGDFSPTSYTNWGPGVDITAPGGEADYHTSGLGGVLSTLPAHLGSYGYMEGTSMACPHVSGVAALGLAYAAKRHKHFRSTDYKEMLLRSVQPIDVHLTGEKLFHYYWSLIGDTHPTLVDLGRVYRGKMGSGVIDAGLLLDNIDREGAELVLSNAYVGVGRTQVINLARCFDGGEQATFTATIDDGSVAELTVSNGLLTVRGLKTGRSAFSVTSSGGQTQKAFVTVRENAGENGWL